ncbi:hypothetical protein AALB81_00570 [Lachnospiraceae bacterium 48-33]
MGLFLHMAITKLNDLSKVREMISEAANANKDNMEKLQVKEENCQYTEYDSGIRIAFNDDIPSPEFLAAFSLKTDSPLLFLYIYDGDFWGYTLYDKGEEIDDFSTMPDYFIKSDNKTENSADHAARIAECFRVSEDAIKNYLIAWTDEMMDNEECRAYSNDISSYGDCWQMTDFMDKLGFPYEEEDEKEDEEPQQENISKEMIKKALAERENIKDSEFGFVSTSYPEEKNTEELPNVLDLDYINSILNPETRRIFELTTTGHYRQAVIEFTKKISENPEDANLYILRAYCYLALRNRMEMDRDLGSALKYDPDNIKILRCRCPVAATKNRCKRHIEDLTRLMELDKEYYEIYLLARAWRYYWTGDTDAACADIAELIRRANSWTENWSRDFVYLCEVLGISL